MDYDNEIERWYRPENFEPSDDDKVESLWDLVPVNTAVDYLFNADWCQYPGENGQMSAIVAPGHVARFSKTVEDMEGLCA